jgi:hypothetical protein
VESVKDGMRYRILMYLHQAAGDDVPLTLVFLDELSDVGDFIVAPYGSLADLIPVEVWMISPPLDR